MKKSALTITSLSMAAIGLSVLPLLAIDTSSIPAKNDAAALAANTTTVYVVKVTGKG